MKKSATALAAILMLAAFMPRPALAEVTFDLGAKAGVSISNARWNDDDGTEKPLVRPTFGVFAAVNITPNLALQPEIDYLTVGESWTGTLDSSTYKEIILQNYLHIPVLIKARLARKGDVVPVAFAGPALNVLLSARYKGYLDGTLDADEDIKEVFKSTEFGADFGLGVEMSKDNIKFILEARCYLGLSDPYIPEDAEDMYALKNNALMITYGVMF